jgi:hypothetical protein
VAVQRVAGPAADHEALIAIDDAAINTGGVVA